MPALLALAISRGRSLFWACASEPQLQTGGSRGLPLPSVNLLERIAELRETLRRTSLAKDTR